MAEQKWPTWLISYNYDGARYSMSVVAPDADDAMRRVERAAAWGSVDGKLIATVPMAAGGFLAPLACWMRNRFTKAR